MNDKQKNVETRGLGDPEIAKTRRWRGIAENRRASPESKASLWGLMREETPTMPSASGAFDHSPQFQLRVRNPDAQLVPTGRLKLVVVRVLARVKSHWFSRPCGRGVLGRTPPAVETAGYGQIVPAGRETASRRGETFLERLPRKNSRIEPLNRWKTSNTEHPTSNIQCLPFRSFSGCWAFEVGGWVFSGFRGRVAASPAHEPGWGQLVPTLARLPGPGLRGQAVPAPILVSFPPFGRSWRAAA